MRKVKHLTVNLTPILDQDGGQIWWALVYVPQGTTAGSIQLATTAALSDMYEPNQSSSDLHITPQIYISYEICGACRCSIP